MESKTEKEEIDLSIIIPSYNSHQTLESCLESVVAETKRISAKSEIIVVESGDENLVKTLSPKFGDVNFISSKERLYPGEARNTGAARARGKTLVFIDSDCKPKKGWLTWLEVGHELSFQAVSGSTTNGTPQSVVGTAEYLLCHSYRSPAIPPQVISASTAPSGNFSVKKEIFDSCDGFGATPRAGDFELTAKIEELGIEIFFMPFSVVSHTNNCQASKFLREQKKRGKWAARKRIEYGWQGKIAGRIPLLAFGIFPVRLLRLVRNSILYPCTPPARFSKSLPWVLLGLSYWTWGFYKEATEARRDSIAQGKEKSICKKLA